MNLAGSTVLVTGGCGLIGSTIVDQLLRDEDVAEVRVIDNLTRGSRRNLSHAMSTNRVQLIPVDVRHADRIRPHFEGVDVVFHQAAIRITACAQQWRECHDVLVTGTFNVAEACAQAGVRRLVAASSASVYGMASEFPTAEGHHRYGNDTLYGAAKIANEAMLRAFHSMTGLSYLALRYFNVYGPRMDVFGKYTEVMIRWLECFDRGEPPKVFGDGSDTMDFIYVDDVARANVLAAKSTVEDQVFNVGTGNETSLLQLLDTLKNVCKRTGEQAEFLPARKVNPVKRRLADVTRADRLLGFRASIGLEEGLRRLVQWRRELIDRGGFEEYLGNQPDDATTEAGE